MILKNFQYRPEIDGLRALSVFAVLFFHARFHEFSGGYLGVDVFFVISGYLITSILLSKFGDDRFSFIGFYESRVRRIFPALAAVILVSLPFAWKLMVPEDLKTTFLSAGAAITFVSNFFFWSQEGYFSAASIEKPFLHTWSLSVEGQFYLIYPLFVFILQKFRPALFFPAIAATLLISLGLAQWAGMHSPVAAFFLAPTRAWELLLGASVCFVETRPFVRNRVLAEILSICGVAMIVFAIIVYTEDTPTPTLYTLVPTLGTAFFLTFARKGTLAHWVFSQPVLVMAGLISYSLYLWHYPIFSFYAFYNPEPLQSSQYIAAIAVSIFAAYVSWRFIERPFRMKGVVPPKALWSLSALCVTVLLGTSYAGNESNGFQKNFESRSGPFAAAINTAIASNGFEAMVPQTDCRFWVNEYGPKLSKRFDACLAKYGKPTLVFGDSHSMDLYNAFALNSPAKFILGILRPGCRMAAPDPSCDPAAMTAFIRDHAKDIGQAFFTEKGAFFLNKKGHTYTINLTDVDMTQTYLCSLGLKLPVVWLGPQQEPTINLKKINPMTGKQPVPRLHLMHAIGTLDGFLSNRFGSHACLTYVSKLDAVGYEHARDFKIDGVYTYSDENHWSRTGERVFGKRLLDALRRMGLVKE